VRGCLFVVVFAAAVLAALAWFAAPLLASTVVATALENGGYHATTSTITVTSDPPPRLLLGRADRVEIVGADVDFRTFHAASLDLVLTDVDVIGRTAGGISGRITGAEMKTNDGTTTAADVAIAGAANAAAASIRVAGATVDSVVRSTFQREFGVAVTATSLEAPDVIRITGNGSTLEGRLTVDPNGAISMSTALGSSPILSLDPAFPLRLRSVGVVGGDLLIDATLDAEELLGG
jgi:hypothetical protein